MKYRAPRNPQDFSLYRRLYLFACLGLALLLPIHIAAQDFDDTVGDTYEDEYSDEYYDDEGYFEDDYYDEGDYPVEDGYYDDEYFEGGDDYYEGDDEFYGDGGEFYDDEGFDDEFSDEELDEFDAEFEEEDLDLADDQAGEVELAEVERKEIKEPRIPWGYTAKVSVSSPWLVGLGLTPWWYSFIDGHFVLDFPAKSIAGQTLSYSAEISTYSFDNKHPSGGTFQGIALLGYLRFPWGPLELSGGGGLYGFETITGGLMFGASYRVPFIKFLDITVDSRMNYVMKSAKGEPAYWFDIGGSIGYLF